MAFVILVLLLLRKDVAGWLKDCFIVIVIVIGGGVVCEPFFSSVTVGLQPVCRGGCGGCWGCGGFSVV